MAGGYALISDVPKTLVYELAAGDQPRAASASRAATIEKPPSAELRPNQKDTDSLPPYDRARPAHRGPGRPRATGRAGGPRGRGVPLALARGDRRRIDRNEYKRRQMPPGPEGHRARLRRRAALPDRPEVPWLKPAEKYVWKEIPGSSHDLLRRRIRALPPGLRLLDLGAAGGHLGRAVRDRCAFLAGVEPDAGAAAVLPRRLRRLARGRRAVRRRLGRALRRRGLRRRARAPRAARGAPRAHPGLAAPGRHPARLAPERGQRHRPRRARRRAAFPTPSAGSSTARTCASTRAARAVDLLAGAGLPCAPSRRPRCPTSSRCPRSAGPPGAGRCGRSPAPRLGSGRRSSATSSSSRRRSGDAHRPRHSRLQRGEPDRELHPLGVARWAQSRPGGWDWEVILVDDGSTDDTSARARRFAAEEKLDLNVGLVRTRTAARARAIRAGVLASSGDPVLVSDTDLSTPLSEWAKLAETAPDAPDRDRLARARGGPRPQAAALLPAFMGPHVQPLVRLLTVPRHPRHAVRLQALPRRRRARALPPGARSTASPTTWRSSTSRSAGASRSPRSRSLVQLPGVEGLRRPRRAPDSLGPAPDPVDPPAAEARRRSRRRPAGRGAPTVRASAVWTSHSGPRTAKAGRSEIGAQPAGGEQEEPVSRRRAGRAASRTATSDEPGPAGRPGQRAPPRRGLRPARAKEKARKSKSRSGQPPPPGDVQERGRGAPCGRAAAAQPSSGASAESRTASRSPPPRRRGPRSWSP